MNPFVTDSAELDGFAVGIKRNLTTGEYRITLGFGNTTLIMSADPATDLARMILTAVQQITDMTQTEERGRG